MLTQKELSNIELFDDIFYKSCKYNPILTGLYYLGGSVLPFLSNDFFTYDFVNKDSKLNSDNIIVKPEFDLIKSMGIDIENIINSDNYKKEIKESIDNNMPVFVPIDRYHWNDPIHNSSRYNKSHQEHFFLIYGYNESNNTYNIIDVTLNGTGCFKNSIDCNELIKCYISYRKDNYMSEMLNMFKMHPKCTYVNNNNWIDKTKYTEIFVENFNENKLRIMNGLENIKKAVEYYKSYPSQDLIKKGVSGISDPFGFIEHSKRVQMYQIYTFFGHQVELLNILKEIVTNFNFIRGLLCKVFFKQTSSEKKFVSVIDKLNLIYDLEQNYYNKLTVLINNWR